MRATTVELFDGLVAASQNRWPSLGFDVGAINGVLSRFLPAGFYYKTFMWPPSPQAWLRYEHVIRAAAGMGRAATEPDPDRYEHQYAHCDVLIVGGGPAGLAAARAAAAAGARVIRLRRRPALRRQPDRRRRDDRWRRSDALDRRHDARARSEPGRHAARAHDGLRLLRRQPRRTCSSASPIISRRRRRTCRGSGCGKFARASIVLAIGRARAADRLREQRSARHDARGRGAHLRQALRGAAGNARGRLHDQRQRLCGRRSRCATPTSRSPPSSTPGPRRSSPARCRSVRARSACRSSPASGIVGAHGGKRVAAVDIAPLGWRRDALARLRSRLRLRRLESGGPSVLAGARHAALRRGAGCAPAAIIAAADSSPAGAANGRFGLAAALADGHAAGLAAARGSGTSSPALRVAAGSNVDAGCARTALWSVPARNRGDKRFVDLQTDVTVDDIALAAREGYTSVEHLKRYTTLGMGTDQGKTSNVVGLALLAEATGSDDPRGRHDDVPPAVHARDARRVPGAGMRRARRADALFRDARLARRARRALRQRGAVEAAAFVSARRRIARRRRQPRSEERAHERRRRRRLHARQDRAPGEGRRRVAESRLHQPLGHARRRPLPLRRDAARRRHRAGRRHDVAPWRDALPDDDDDRQCGHGDAASRAPAAGRLAGARRVRHVGHRAVGGGGAGGTEGARRARADRRHRRVERGISVPRRRANATCALRADRFRRVSSG